MAAPRIEHQAEGDKRYYKRALNYGFIWNLQHRPRRRLVEMFLAELAPRPEESLLDLGTAALAEPMENVLECLYPWPERITAVGTEDCSFLEARYPGLSFLRVEPGAPLPFADNHFDLAFSNAVIEHVGSRENQRRFLAELVRVSRRSFLATPNRWFPVELHTRLPLLHWLPPRVFRAALSRLGFDFYAREENLNLLTASELLGMLPASHVDVSLKRNRFLGLTSNLALVIAKRG
jgi:hypothetical protein